MYGSTGTSQQSLRHDASANGFLLGYVRSLVTARNDETVSMALTKRLLSVSVSL